MNKLVRESAQQATDAPLLTGSELRRILHDWNNTRAEIPDVCVHELIEKPAARDRYFAWREFLTGPTDTYEISGDHTGIFQERDVRVSAERLQVHLRNNV